MTVSVLVVLPATVRAAQSDEAEFSHSLIQQVKETWVVESEDGAQRIQNLTAYCVACHGDLKEAAGGKIHGTDSGVHSHPVDQSYPETGTDLVPLNELDRRLLLIDGKMTCITCHSHTAPDRQLVIADAYGKLCISCHRK